jgi:hypothetical protein
VVGIVMENDTITTKETTLKLFHFKNVVPHEDYLHP